MIFFSFFFKFYLLSFLHMSFIYLLSYDKIKNEFQNVPHNNAQMMCFSYIFFNILMLK